MATDPDAFLMGGVKYPTALTKAEIGDSVEGIVVARKVTQQTDLKTAKPLFWNKDNPFQDNGQPREQLVVTIQTKERDPSVEDDDGKRRLFFKFKMLDALRDALKKSGTKLHDGDWVKVTKSGELPPPEGTKGLSPTNLYTVEHKAGDDDAANLSAGADAANAEAGADKTAEEKSVSAEEAAAAKAAFDALPDAIKAQLLKQQGS